MHDRTAPHATSVFHIINASFLIAVGAALVAVSRYLHQNESDFHRQAGIPALPHGGTRMPDVLSCSTPYGRCRHPWGLSHPMVASFLLIFIAFVALALLLAGRCYAWANDLVIRVYHGILMLAALAALLFVASLSFLMYSREPALAAAWRRTVRDDPLAICIYEARANCHGFRDMSCTLKKCANCTASAIAGKNATEIAEVRREVGRCFGGYIAHKGMILADGLISVIASLFVAVDLFVLVYFCSRNMTSGDSPSKAEEQDHETPDASLRESGSATAILS